jgi:hypothetical protein
VSPIVATPLTTKTTTTAAAKKSGVDDWGDFLNS